MRILVLRRQGMGIWKCWGGACSKKIGHRFGISQRTLWRCSEGRAFLMERG